MAVKFVWITPDAERLMGYCARVSNPENQENPNVAGLLRYCIAHGHWSVFEMADICVEIQTTRGISAQIIRHRSFHFQEFCVAGETLITTVPQPSEEPECVPIEALFRRGESARGVRLRVYDEARRIFTTAPLREVFFTGRKPVYEVALADGKTIRCTKEHRFLTRDGFERLEAIVGLQGENERARMTKPGVVGTNGLASLARETGGVLVPRWVEISAVRYLGVTDTYDLEVWHRSHNYVAGRIVVHNSQRYAAVQRIEHAHPRRQDPKNRQSSHDDLSAETLAWFEKAQTEHFSRSLQLYEQALEAGIAKESARFLLPMASGTTIYMKGTVRDWIHYINLRSDPSTQLEHREIAEACRDLFVDRLPVVAEALGWREP